jgi:hypothetical protein
MRDTESAHGKAVVERKHSTIEVKCPCCGATLRVDPELRKVVWHSPPVKPVRAPDLDRAADLLEREASRREDHFRQSAEEQRIKSEVLERKFRESLERSQGEPVRPPERDIDLD